MALPEAYVSPDVAALRLAVSPQAVRKMCRNGKLPGARRFGRAWGIPPAALARRSLDDAGLAWLVRDLDSVLAWVSSEIERDVRAPSDFDGLEDAIRDLAPTLRRYATSVRRHQTRSAVTPFPAGGSSD